MTNVRIVLGCTKMPTLTTLCIAEKFDWMSDEFSDQWLINKLYIKFKCIVVYVEFRTSV